MSKSKPIEKILAGWDDFERPKDGTVYRHYKGDLYEVVTTGILEDTEAPCVIYRSLKKKTVWVRTAKNFLEEIEHNDRNMPRFSKVDPSKS